VTAGHSRTAFSRRRVGVLVVTLLAAALVGALLVFSPSASLSAGAVRSISRALQAEGLAYGAVAPVVGFVLNVALFVPGSFAAAMLWRRVRWWQWVLIGLLVTAGIETLQGLFLRGRDAQLHDLVANTLGAALGSGAAFVLRRARDRSPASSAR
jgi:VanZ like family